MIVTEIARKATVVPVNVVPANSVPANEMWFELIVDHTIDPLDVVCSAGFTPIGWTYLGPSFWSVRKVYRVKLEDLGCVDSLEQAEQAADKLGCRLLEGQACEPFLLQYPVYDDQGSVIFGGAQWRGPDGYPGVARLNGFGERWYLDFQCAGDRVDEDCRWAVVSKEPDA